MKLVQFLRPLFFVALGLHGLLLFIPIGETESAVVEDIALGERPELEADLRSDLRSVPPAPGGLPVPDPNVATGTALAGATAKRSQPTRAAASARTAPARTARTAPRSRPPVALGGSPNTANADADKTDLDANRSTGPGSSDASQANSSGNSQQSTAGDRGSSASSVQQAQTEARENRTASEGNATSDNPASGDRLTALASSAIRDFPDAVESLEALVAAFDKSLAYREADMTDESAKRSRNQWTADLQQQANTSSPTAIAITEISDAFQINYPIRVSENLLEDELKAPLSGRDISLCLEKDPGDAEVGVFFDAQGNPVNEPTIIRSTGYLLLDEEIKAMAASPESLPPESPLASALNRRSSAYILDVSVNYNKAACVSLLDLQEQGE